MSKETRRDRKDVDIMALTIEVAKNVDDYKESMFLGFDSKKTMCILKSVLAGGAAVLLLRVVFGIPVSSGVTFGLSFVTAPIVLLECYKKDGLTLKEILFRRYRPGHTGAHIIQYGNTVDDYRYYVDEELEERQRSLEESKGKKKTGVFQLLKGGRNG